MVLSLFIWGVYNYFKIQEMSLPLILFSLQFVVYFLVTSIEKMKVGDSSGKKQILISLGIIFLLIIFGAIPYLTAGH
jgi:hypothetical protein